MAAAGLAGCATDPPPPSDLPLDELRAAIGTATTDRRHEASVAFEEALAACMHEQGFEYVPEARTAAQDLPAEDARDFAQRWGYGISTAPTASAEPTSVPTPQMSAAEEEAYNAAMFGDWGTSDGEGAADGEVGSGGCWEIANAARRTEPDTPAEAVALADDLELLEKRIAVDPRVLERNRDWSDCMAEAGFEIDTPADAAQAAITAGQEVVAAADDPTAPDVLSQVQDTERLIAVTDLDCQESVDLEPVLRRVRAEYEREFVAAHGPEVEALIALLSESAPPDAAAD